MKKLKNVLNLLAIIIITITINSNCGSKNKSEDSQNENLSKIKQNVKDYICKNVIYFPESYEALKFVVDTVYVNTELIAQKKEKEAALEKDKNSLASVEKFIKNYEKVDAMIKHPKDSDDPTNQEGDAYAKGSTYYSKERNHLENLKSEIMNLPLQISELEKQIEQNKNVIKSYNIFHAFNAKDKENKLSVTEANIVIDKDFKVISYNLPSVNNNNSAASSSQDCDKFIKDYEEFVNSYIAVLKKYKANPTDASIIGEYAQMATKATEMQTGASNCTDAKYATKLMTLSTKIANAAAGL